MNVVEYSCVVYHCVCIVEGPLVHVLCWVYVVEMMVFRVSTDQL